MEERRLTETLPDDLVLKMKAFGSDLTAARKARSWSQSALSEKLNVSRKTVVAMEQGSPAVSFGAYAAAAWVMGLERNLLSTFDPEVDPVFQQKARLDLPKRVRASRGPDLGDLDF